MASTKFGFETQPIRDFANRIWLDCRNLILRLNGAVHLLVKFPFSQTGWLMVAMFLLLRPPPLAAQERPLLRHMDNRAPVNVQAAEKHGIRGYPSKRLLLYTDIEPEKARELVKLVDQVYATWEFQFGPLPEARDKSEFQITGYLMKDPAKFEKANLHHKHLNLANIIHGQNDGYAFWMQEQEWDYYREHLLLHEATHCVTQCREEEGDERRPLWFIEGMAEYFGTHELTGEGPPPENRLRFGIIPASAEAAHGFGRIELIRAECEAGRTLSAADVQKLGAKEFSESRTTPYAWSWALCHFLATHPTTSADYRSVCHQWESAEFHRELMKFWSKHKLVIESDWEVFRQSLCYGFDLSRGATVRGEVNPLEQGATREVRVEAARGWQSTGIAVTAGQRIKIIATGRVVLAQTTKPWESEPQGISIRYSEGKPIGRLLGAVQRVTLAEAGPIRQWEFFDIGPEGTQTMPAPGTLYLRVNDRWNELADNTGDYRVTVSAVE